MSRNFSALGLSVAIHAILLTSMALYHFKVIPQDVEGIIETVLNEERQQVEFSQQLDINTDVSQSLSFVAGAATATETADILPASEKKIDNAEALQEPDVPFSLAGTVALPPSNMLGNDLGEVQISGETGAVVGGYGAAMSGVSHELLRMMRQEKVMVVWLFDESESMRDDRATIRDQFHKIYEELKIAQAQQDKKGKANKEAFIQTVILSYGSTIHTLTKRPTADISEIQTAIDKVPDDKTGEENLMRSLKHAMDTYTRPARVQKRKLVIIVVTDESGDDGDGVEGVLEASRRAKAPIYFMTRESIFGYPYASQTWVDKETGISFPVRVRRGPETAYPECLQYDGLHERWDSYSSGFGPYEMTRLARESGGVLYILPGSEKRLRGAGGLDMKRVFDNIAMKEYEPLLLSRRNYHAERQKSEFRNTIWNVINDLNPFQRSEIKVREHHYSIKPDEFKKHSNTAFKNAKLAFAELTKAIAELEKIRPLRAKESSTRWRASYDLAYAQCLAYQVRLFQAMLAIDQFNKQFPKPKKADTNEWDLRRVKELIPPDPQVVKATGVNLEALDKQKAMANKLFKEIQKVHQGTPWAQRAKREFDQGYGIKFVEMHRDPRYHDPAVKKRIPKF